MKIIGININGINISQEDGRYVLQKDNIKMRCDTNELNDCIPEFEEYLAETTRKQQVG